MILNEVMKRNLVVLFGLRRSKLVNCQFRIFSESLPSAEINRIIRISQITKSGIGNQPGFILVKKLNKIFIGEEVLLFSGKYFSGCLCFGSHNCLVIQILSLIHI